MAFISFHPYKALLSLFGHGVAPQIARAGKKIDQGDVAFDSIKRQVAAWFRSQTTLSNDRIGLYRDFDFMDSDDILSSALDLYAEDATQTDGSSGKAVWIGSNNKDIATLGNDLLEAVEMEDKVFAIARGLAKYGDHWEAVLTGLSKDGRPVRVVGLEYRTPHTMARVEDAFGMLKGFIAGVDIATLETSKIKDTEISLPWDYIHWRLVGRSVGEGEDSDMYGSSLIRSSRRVYKRLTMMEEALCLYRIKRTPDRLKWTVDVGDAPPDEVNARINEFRLSLRKKMLFNPDTGTMNSEVDILSLDEDFFIPGGEGIATDVQVLVGSSQVGHVLDIEYMRKRLFSCLRIPPDYMGFSDSAGSLSGRSPLADQDVQFARQEKRLQRAIMSGVIMLFKIDLALRGIDPERKENAFTVNMSPVSFLDELQRAEVAKVRASIVEILLAVGKSIKANEEVWLPYVLSLSGFPEDVVPLLKQAEESGELTEEVKAALHGFLESEQVQRFWRKLPLGASMDSSARPLRLTSFPQSLVEARESKEKKNVEARKPLHS